MLSDDESVNGAGWPTHATGVPGPAKVLEHTGPFDVEVTLEENCARNGVDGKRERDHAHDDREENL